jgi:methionyl-tRNA formyltransferase
VARRARELGLPLAQPSRLRGNEQFHEALRVARPDVAITAAYGRILPASLLQIPKHGFLNVHASLLPRYRGAAPVQWALIEGQAQTGITIMQTDVGLDTGAVRLQRRTDVAASEDAHALLERLSVLGAETMLEALILLSEGTLPLTPQDDSAATLAPPLKAEDGWVRWTETAEQVFNRWRGVAMWPGTSFLHEGQRVKVEALSVSTAPEGRQRPGEVLAVGADGVLLAAGQGAVLLERVKPPGKRAMHARDWANGRGVRKGVRLG